MAADGPTRVAARPHAFAIVAGLWLRTYMVPMDLLLLFFFFDLRSVCVALPFVAASTSTLP